MPRDFRQEWSPLPPFQRGTALPHMLSSEAGPRKPLPHSRAGDSALRDNTSPTYGAQQVKLALAIFEICQLGNFSIHMALRNLGPAGSKTRKIAFPTKNPFTWLFPLVSCPNYTYEVGSWIGFTIMTQCLPVALFSLVGFTQMMTILSKGKHRSYLKEFRHYPPLRSPIVPCLL
ncbi:PREDICTED: very-long-chain enoyl-CoA reductase-like [Elephantulus edwardii]|uniref:very-long-chain enoyl-CoA reductase-like n=1 Tax=Elephantulus edwardii TaxID=28737 RepID=UPI0003F075C2|nr:PREDICTED: very-long-chain enoyl-CoA reductase-like [Elephantulus edwardii]